MNRDEALKTIRDVAQVMDNNGILFVGYHASDLLRQAATALEDCLPRTNGGPEEEGEGRDGE